MEENKDTLRDRLIVTGAKEIADNGIAGFSLRKIASQCGISCAAPYKHFKNKDELILEIIRYINAQWELLRDQILMIFEGDDSRCLLEVCIAYIRFWVTNPSYRKVLSAYNKENSTEEHSFADIDALIQSYCHHIDASEENIKLRTLAIKAKIYGITTMLEHEELSNTEETFVMIRKVLEEEL
ncbi:MAG: TetR/AcrR family transcriptional regulator [Ruminococcaceae bacterium]|nr:TetR/AcrR family transcriptional regulator [Oscillospiraceae bacterium]